MTVSLVQRVDTYCLHCNVEGCAATFPGRPNEPVPALRARSAAAGWQHIAKRDAQPLVVHPAARRKSIWALPTEDMPTARVDICPAHPVSPPARTPLGVIKARSIARRAEILRLLEVEKKSPAEIAALLGVTAGRVYALIDEARTLRQVEQFPPAP